MDLDELKHGLSTLAGEMTPFAADVDALHRRQRRRRIVTSAVTACVIVALTVATVAISHSRDSGKVHVAGLTGKEVAAGEITHVDVIVVPATPAVKAALDASPLVARYAFVPRADRSSSALIFQPDSGLCALQTRDGYAVDASTPGTAFQTGLEQALSGRATVYDSASLSFDVEIFMQVGIAHEYAMAVQYGLTHDPDVRSVQYLTTSDAYAVFKKDFVDQPELVHKTKPSDLPESFRVILDSKRSAEVIRHRYEHADGVEIVLTAAAGPEVLFDPAPSPKFPGTPVSPCAKPKP